MFYLEREPAFHRVADGVDVGIIDSIAGGEKEIAEIDLVVLIGVARPFEGAVGRVERRAF